jgi:hypothetical protein
LRGGLGAPSPRLHDRYYLGYIIYRGDELLGRYEPPDDRRLWSGVTIR